jgi:hypothetical protein
MPLLQGMAQPARSRRAVRVRFRQNPGNRLTIAHVASRVLPVVKVYPTSGGMFALTEDLVSYLAELMPKTVRGRAFAISASLQFLSVPLVSVLAWLLIPGAHLSTDGWRWLAFVPAVGALLEATLQTADHRADRISPVSQHSNFALFTVIGAGVAIGNSLMSLSYHTYQSELFPTPMRAVQICDATGRRFTGW